MLQEFIIALISMGPQKPALSPTIERVEVREHT
jgi:hypothetical protein